MTIVDLAVAAPPAAPFGAPDHDPVEDLWSRLRRPFDQAAALAALTGLPVRAASSIVATAIAGSAEADRLLDRLPHTIRGLATATTIHQEVCRGELRGPVLWSETMSARASSFGDQDLYVCAMPSRAYDVAENRVLVAALVAVRDAAEVALDRPPADDDDTHSPAWRHLRRNGHDARRFVEHPSLHDVVREVPTGKELKRTRSGKKRRTYEPALAMLARVANPMTPADVRDRGDARVAAQLHVLTGVLAGLEGAGVALASVRALDDHLEIGGLTFHARRAGATSADSGIAAGPVLIDVPDDVATDADRSAAGAALTGRAAGRTAVLVAGDEDLPRAVDALLSLRSRGRPRRS